MSAPPVSRHGSLYSAARSTYLACHMVSSDPSTDTCWLCGRPLGRRVEWHHPVPKSRGGRETVPIHPICHRTLHAVFSNADLARFEAEGTPLSAHPKIAKFLAWIANKPPDFHAPTHRRR
ncbi:HNH endonuclease [Afifella sp. H1R]|uniref:HNH endonuclease n=1 Tax=Afifella sp. H1R TaxID=2908841 RepID=UPI001F3A281A|nr:HNH endonuclease [Afifella sp. H1R]